MYIQKEPEMSGATKIQKEKKKDEVLEETEKKKKALAGLKFQEQEKILKPEKDFSQQFGRQKHFSTAVEKLKALFREYNLPEKLVPNNVKNFQFNPSTGELVIELENIFSKNWTKEHALTFEKKIALILKKGELLNIMGIRKGSSSVTAIQRSKPGFFAISGKMEEFPKPFDLREQDIPSMP